VRWAMYSSLSYLVGKAKSKAHSNVKGQAQAIASRLHPFVRLRLQRP
jgi:hypothetical protein